MTQFTVAFQDGLCVQTRPRGKKSGFTLIELLAVVAIVGILASLGFSSLSRTMTRAKTAKCGENVRRLLVAIQLYAADNEGNLPYSYYDPPQMWWHQEIAPYVGFDWDKTIRPNPWMIGSRLPEIFHCPADPLWGKVYAVDPSYGINHTLTKTIPSGTNVAGTPRTKAVAVPNPAGMILLADSGHAAEDGDVAWRIGKTQASQAPRARHDGYGPIGWLDGHVTMETADRLKELHKEPSPWPNWEIPK